MSKTTIKTLIISMALVVVSAGLLGFMVLQVIQQGEQLEDRIQALEKEESQRESHVQLSRKAENTVSERAELKSYFLARESDSIDFLNQVEGMAADTGISLQTSGLDSIVDKTDESKWIQAKFSFSGSRERVQRFIKILETFPLVSRITSVDMNARSSTEWQAAVTMQVRVLEYVE